MNNEEMEMQKAYDEEIFYNINEEEPCGDWIPNPKNDQYIRFLKEQEAKND